jgi:hypothetical protein
LQLKKIKVAYDAIGTVKFGAFIDNGFVAVYGNNIEAHYEQYHGFYAARLDVLQQSNYQRH